MTQETSDGQIISCIIKWEKLRILYNAILFVTGFVSCVYSLNKTTGKFLPPQILFDVIVYGFISNIFYCLGPLISIYLLAFSRGKIDITWPLFSIGMLFSFILTGVIPILMIK
mgnify:CR=1 FL=1